ncbi:hypothetical protein [Bradyrhizobium stylosanthis]|nr:hypothetical protein [Bradyrhizobium stylosanthis]
MVKIEQCYLRLLVAQPALGAMLRASKAEAIAPILEKIGEIERAVGM